MKSILKKGLSIALTIAMIFSFSSQSFAATLSDNYLNGKNGYNIDENSLDIPQEYLGIDLFEKNFNVESMTTKEEEFYNYLLDREAKNYLKNSHTNEGIEEVKEELDDIVSGNKALRENYMNVMGANVETYIHLNRSAPWWHLNTVSKVGNAINILIGAGIAAIGGGLASGGIRALIAKVGEAEAKKLVQNVVVNKVKNQMIAWGMSGLVSKVGNGMVQAIMWVADPGTRIAEMLDENDPHPNNGYVELW